MIMTIDAVRMFLAAEAATLSIIFVLFLMNETHFHKFLEVVFGLPSSADGAHGTCAKELMPNTSIFHDIQSVTGDVLCLALTVRALCKEPIDKSAGCAAPMAIFVDHGGFAAACFLQWGLTRPPVIQGRALAAVAFYLHLSGAVEEEEVKMKKDKQKNSTSNNFSSCLHSACTGSLLFLAD